MPVNQSFDLGARPLTTQDLLDDRPRRLSIRHRQRGGSDVPEPSKIIVTLLDTCDGRAQLASVTHLEFFPDAVVPIPRRLRTFRWLQLEGCGPLTAYAPPPDAPRPPSRTPPAPPPDIHAIVLRRAMRTGFATLEVDESWFGPRPAPIDFVLRRRAAERIADTEGSAAPEIRSRQQQSVFALPLLDGHRERALGAQAVTGDRSARNQAFHDTLATSGPILCEDIDLGPAPSGRVPACVPSSASAQARFVADPREACGR